MKTIHPPAVIAAAVLAFLLGALWYSTLLFGPATTRLRGSAPAEVPAVALLGEVARCLVVAFVLARLVALAGVTDWKGAVTLGVWVWIGFPLTLLAGSVLWEQVRWQLAAIHAGDWLVKLVLMAVVLGVWRARGS